MTKHLSWIILLYLHPLVIFCDKEQQLSTLWCFLPNKGAHCHSLQNWARCMHTPIDPKSKRFYLKHSNHCFVLVIQNTHAIYIWLFPIFVCEWTLLNNKIVFPTILFIVQWIKHAQTNPSLHALSLFSPNLFMCIVWGIQVHKPPSLVSQSTKNM